MTNDRVEVKFWVGGTFKWFAAIVLGLSEFGTDDDPQWHLKLAEHAPDCDCDECNWHMGVTDLKENVRLMEGVSGDANEAGASADVTVRDGRAVNTGAGKRKRGGTTGTKGKEAVDEEVDDVDGRNQTIADQASRICALEAQLVTLSQAATTAAQGQRAAEQKYKIEINSGRELLDRKSVV